MLVLVLSGAEEDGAVMASLSRPGGSWNCGSAGEDVVSDGNTRNAGEGIFQNILLLYISIIYCM